jgi:hypothetical protein
MGRYLDLLRRRGDQTSEEIRECDISDRSDRSDRSPPRPPLRSLLSLLSHSRTRDLGEPAEPKLPGVPLALQPLSASATEATQVDLTSTSESPIPDYTLPEGQVISPVRWASAMAAGGSSFEEPCPERRGLVERRGAVFVHFCVECGRWGAYGRRNPQPSWPMVLPAAPAGRRAVSASPSSAADARHRERCPYMHMGT